MNTYKTKIATAILALFTFSSCLNDLNTEPKVEMTLENLLKYDPNAINGMLSKIYATYSLSGPNGASSSDIQASDSGSGVFLRNILNLEDFSADGMKNRWGDDGLDQLTTTNNWNANNKFMRYLWDRVYYTVAQSNNLLQILKTTTANVPNKENVIAELRFLRALAFFYQIDCFGQGPLTLEEDLNTTTPKAISNRKELFAFVENELKAIEPVIATTKSYGHANQSVVQMLLAKLYLNAQVYTGTPRYDDAFIYANKVINSGLYQLESNFVKNFSADNDTSNEIIFTLIADANVSQSYGNTTYIVNGSLSSNTMPDLNVFGATSGWGGHRATKAWYGLYNDGVNGDLNKSSDDRAKLFWTDGHNYEMDNYKTWKDGYPSIKFRNTRTQGTSISTDFSSTDFPMFRLADAYLMRAECAVRGAAGSSLATALSDVNAIRTRAKAPAIAPDKLTLQFILDERARELNLEGHRRTDLIRFGRFTGALYVWPWKGGVKQGVEISNTYNLYPIPTAALQSNSNLKQNPGY